MKNSLHYSTEGYNHESRAEQSRAEQSRAEQSRAEQSRKIQFCRAFAIISVVAIHNCPDGQIATLIRPFLNFSVALFIFLSGILTTVPVSNIKPFYKKRLLRVLIPYTIWSAAYTVMYGNYNDFIRNFLTANCCFPFYYIAVYTQLVVLTPILGRLLHSKWWKSAFILSPVIILYRSFCAWNELENAILINYRLFFVWFGYYYLGLCIRNGRIRIKGFSRRILSVFLAGCFFLQVAEGNFWYLIADNFDMATTQIKISAFLTNTVVCLILAQWIQFGFAVRDKLLSRIAMLIGNDSFAIYLSHIAVMTILNITVYKIVPLHFLGRVIVVICTCIVCSEIGKKILGTKCSKYFGLV